MIDESKKGDFPEDTWFVYPYQDIFDEALEKGIDANRV